MEKEDGWQRLITLNTWKGDGGYTKRLEAMARGLHQLQPDILFLQEAVRIEDGRIDTAGYLAGCLGLQLAYAPARRKIRKIEGRQYVCHSGLALLSSNELVNQRILQLPTSPGDPDRLALSAAVEVNGQKIVVTNLHLTHLSGADELRLRQFSAVTRQIQAGKKPLLWFCGGDFNCAVDNNRLQSISENSRLQIVDCYLAGGGQSPGDTFVDNNCRPGKGMRLDHIFCLAGEGMAIPPCKNGRIVLNRPDPEGTMPSDHFGVMVDIYPATA